MLNARHPPALVRPVETIDLVRRDVPKLIGTIARPAGLVPKLVSPHPDALVALGEPVLLFAILLVPSREPRGALSRLMLPMVRAALALVPLAFLLFVLFPLVPLPLARVHRHNPSTRIPVG